MKILKYILSTLIVASCVVGCVKYDEIGYELDTDWDDSSIISFVIPTMDAVEVTRSDDSVEGTLGGYDEYAINNGYLFVFSSDATNCKGSISLSDGSITNWSGNEFQINASSAGYETGDKIVAVFNYNISETPDLTSISSVSDINAQFPLDADYLADVTADLTDGTYKLGMPMAVNDFKGDSSVAYHEVYRALARIEVFVKEDMWTDASDTFHSHEFNETNTTYAIMNSVGSGTICPGSTITLDNVETASMPTVYPNKMTPIEDSYNVVSTPANAVYLYPYNYSTSFFDSTSADATTYSSSRFAILLKHTHADGHDHDDQYYKLNIVDRINNNTYYDIERNHDYRVIITKVHTDGYDSAQEAYDAPPSNIEYEIYDDQADATLSNGQYAISMDEVVAYTQLDIYGHNEVEVSFDNISYIIPSEMTDFEMSKLTNEITVSYNTEGSDLSVSVDNPFDSNNSGGNKYEHTGKLTATPQDITFTVTGSGTCTIGLEIQLGNISIGSGEITINKEGSDGEGALDAHPIQLRYEGREYVEGSWQSASSWSDFGARTATDYDSEVANMYNSSDDPVQDISMVIYMGHNATPIGYNTMDGSYTSSASEDSYPIFSEKSREGIYTYINEKEEYITTKVMATQLAPYYIGHFGCENDGTSTHHYKAVIVERIEEIRGGNDFLSWDDDKETTASTKDGSGSRGTIQWSSSLGRFYYNTIWGDVNGMYRYQNFVEGLAICNNIATNPAVNSQATAVMYCYMKNDVNGDGIISDGETIDWYLPAQNQMVGFWISKKQFDEDHNSRGTYYLNEAEVTEYWTCSEIDGNGLWSTPSSFLNYVLPMDMMEGESNILTAKTEQAHVRCMRGVDSY